MAERIIFLQENLVDWKNSSTFAPAFVTSVRSSIG